MEGIILVSATAYADTIWAMSIGQTASKLMVEIIFDFEIKLEIPCQPVAGLCKGYDGMDGVSAHGF